MSHKNIYASTLGAHVIKSFCLERFHLKLYFDYRGGSKPFDFLQLNLFETQPRIGSDSKNCLKSDSCVNVTHTPLWRPHLTEYEALHTAPLTDIKQTVSLKVSTVKLIGKLLFCRHSRCQGVEGVRQIHT